MFDTKRKKRLGGGGGVGEGRGAEDLWLFYYEFLKSFVTFISKGHLLEILITMIYFLCVIIIGENFAEHWLHFTLWYWVIIPNNTRPLITLTRCKFSNFIFRGLFFFFFFFFFFFIRNDYKLQCKQCIQALIIHYVLPFMIRTHALFPTSLAGKRVKLWCYSLEINFFRK